MPDRRLTQEPVEVAEQGTADPKRLTQIVVEVPYQSALHRLTQEVVEGAVQVTGASLFRRFTQIVVEVPITQPVHPFGEQPFPEYPEWSPTYIVDAPEGVNAYASLYGLHSRELKLGQRRHWQDFNRR